MINPLVILIVGFVIWLFLNSIDEILGSVSVFIYFLFIFVNLEGQQTIATFYLIAMLFVIAAQFALKKFAVGEQKEKVKRFSFATLKFDLIGVLLGVGIFLLMIVIQSGRTEGAIIGVPTLAISSLAFAPFTAAILGIVENRLFFTIFNMFVKFNVFSFISVIPVLGFLIVVLPFFFTAFLFGIFHLVAFSLAIGLLIWAMLVFTIWLISYILTGSDLAANTSHYIWNGSIAVGKQLSIIGG